MIKITILLMMISACLTYPADEIKPPIVNAVPENVQMDPVPNQPEPEPVPISEQEPFEKPEEDLTTDNTYWWRKSYYYPRGRSYYYYPRSFSYYKSYPYYSYWNPYSYWW